VTPAAHRPAGVTALDASKPVKIEARLSEDDGTDHDGKSCRRYEFEAAAGKTYRFEARGKVDLELRLEDSKDKVIQREDYGDVGYSHLTFRPSKTGIYHLVVGAARADQTGAFTLTGGDKHALALDLPIGKEPTRVDGRLTKDDELDSMAR